MSDKGDKARKNKQSAESNAGVDAIICAFCGSRTRVWQCRYICSNCGHTSTCSEENIFYDD